MIRKAILQGVTDSKQKCQSQLHKIDQVHNDLVSVKDLI